MVMIEARASGFLEGGEEAEERFEGQYLLAAMVAFVWYEQVGGYFFRDLDDEEESVSLKEEVGEARRLEQLYEKVAKGRNPNLPWYCDPLKEEIWKVASEWADVAIVVAGEIQRRGYSPEEVVRVWKGEVGSEDYGSLMAEARKKLSEMKIDFAEAIMQKLILNRQHYPPELEDWVHACGFSSRMRRLVGDPKSTQMPDLVMFPGMGVTPLAMVQKSPFGSNGSVPEAIVVVGGEVRVAESDVNKTYNNLYGGGQETS